MKLIDLLVSHLGSNGGWPVGAEVCAQDNDCEVVFYSRPGIHRRDNNPLWTIPIGVQSVVVKRRIYIKLADDMETAVISREQYENALAASKQPVWNGEGLPPVGCECEVKRALDWIPCKIVFISDFHVILQAKEEICWKTQACQFLPIRTEAERKRDQISKIIEHTFYTEGKDGNYLRGTGVYDAISAGKILGIKLE